MQFLRDDRGEIDYPTSDGEPMGETDLHRDMMMDLIEALKEHYRRQPNVYVSGNLLLYYEEGNPNAHLSPDVLVTTGISNERRLYYKLWEIGKAPDLIIEVTSRSTRLRDVGVKKGLYEAIGVRDYVLFDPRNEYLSPRFQVYRLSGTGYLRVLAPEEQGYQTGLGLTLRVVDGVLRIFETESGQALKTPQEFAEQAEQERQRAEQERQRAEQERQRADKLVQKLREAGLDPD